MQRVKTHVTQRVKKDPSNQNATNAMTAHNPNYAERNGMGTCFRRGLFCCLMDMGRCEKIPRATIHSACALVDRHCAGAPDPQTRQYVAITMMAAFQVFNKLDSDSPYSTRALVNFYLTMFPRKKVEGRESSAKEDEAEKRVVTAALRATEIRLMNEMGWNPFRFRKETMHGHYRAYAEMFAKAGMTHDSRAAERALDMALLDERALPFAPSDVAMFILVGCSRERKVWLRVVDDGVAADSDYVVPREVETALAYLVPKRDCRRRLKRPRMCAGDEGGEGNKGDDGDVQRFEEEYATRATNATIAATA